MATGKRNKMLIGYARVSKLDQQDTRAQIKALKEVGCKRIFEENASGGRWDRPQLHKALEQLREGDVLVVWKLDRLSRSLKDMLIILDGCDCRLSDISRRALHRLFICKEEYHHRSERMTKPQTKLEWA